MTTERLKRIFFGAFFLLLTPHIVTYSLSAAQPPADVDEQTRAIASELRCPVCQNLSVADSPAELAQEMRALVREQVEQGKSPEEIKKFFVSKYGDWVLLAPPAKGFSALLWWLPALAAVAGLLLVVFVLRRWVTRNATREPATSAAQLPAAAVTATPLPPELPADNESQRDFYRRERERIEAEEKEIEFDFQAGKLSEADYAAMRQRLEGEAAVADQKLASLPAPPAARKSAPQKKAAAAPQQRALKTWQLVAGSVFLLLLGLGLGALLMQATQPRGAGQDTITGGFLTGTASGNVEALLAQGRDAFEKQNWPQAIEAYKKALAADPNNPEALAYMGVMLAQAGHNDGALSAFDRALAADPNFPIALWGKGMLLAQNGGDPAEARRLLEKVSSMMEPGPQKSEVEKTIAGLGKPSTTKPPATKLTAAPAQNPSQPEAQTAATSIQGVVDVDPKVKVAVEPQSVLFVIVKTTSGAGPPLAVKRIAQPKFPVNYSIGPQDVMMPGSVFSGKVFVSARFAKDGNIAAKAAGDLAGEYKKNPIEVGTKNVDFVLEAGR